MKTHAELDAEIARENQAVEQHRKSVYRWSRPKDRVARDEHIMELWEMGYSREDIGEIVDLSPQRISQIVNNWGGTFQ